MDRLSASLSPRERAGVRGVAGRVVAERGAFPGRRRCHALTPGPSPGGRGEEDGVDRPSPSTDPATTPAPAPINPNDQEPHRRHQHGPGQPCCTRAATPSACHKPCPGTATGIGIVWPRVRFDRRNRSTPETGSAHQQGLDANSDDHRHQPADQPSSATPAGRGRAPTRRRTAAAGTTPSAWSRPPSRRARRRATTHPQRGDRPIDARPPSRTPARRRPRAR